MTKSSKKGHFTREYRYKKKEKKWDNRDGTINVNVVKFYRKSCNGFWMWIGMATKINIVAVEKFSYLSYNSVSTIYMCNEKSLFKTYEKAKETKEVMMENVNFEKYWKLGEWFSQTIIMFLKFEKSCTSKYAMQKRG